MCDEIIAEKWNSDVAPVSWADAYKEFKDDIERCPISDVQEVKNGKWIHSDLACSWHAKDECSECNYHTTDRIDLSFFNYCPNCGAKMQGGMTDEKSNQFYRGTVADADIDWMRKIPDRC